jgi:hypothetical protein
MTAPQSWADMFRAHTCFKAMVAMSDKMSAGDRAALRSERVPPCRPCRAWWAQCCAVFDVSVTFTWPGGTWAIPDRSGLVALPHNEILACPEPAPDAMSVVAVENPGCARWAHRASDASVDPEIYQSDLGDEEYGPWLPVGFRRRAFVAAMELWNEANGGVLPSAFGEAGDRTDLLLGRATVLSATPWFTVYQLDGVRACRAGKDVYLWGGAPDDVRGAVRHLQLPWSDLEY